MPAETPAQEPNPQSPFLSTAPAVDVVNRMGQGLGARKTLLVLTGDSGMGKSPLAREAIRRLGDRVSYAWLAEPVAPGDVAGTMLALFGGAARPGTSPLATTERLLMTLANVTTHGRVAMLVVDDAHALADDVLLELQRISGRAAERQCPLEILLVGQPELVTRLAEPALAAVNAQVSQRFELAPLNAHHTRRYLLLLPAPPGMEHPPQFSRKACRDIHTESRGIPRDIEALAVESAQRAANANATTVSPEHVRAAAQAMPRRPAPAKRATSTTPKPVAQAAPKAAAPSTPAKPADAKKAEAKSAEPVKAEPAKAEARSSAPAPVPAPNAPESNGTDATPSGEFEASNDPRVKDWVARFGGSGVRLGGFYSGPVPDEPIEAFEADEPVVEAPVPSIAHVIAAAPSTAQAPAAAPERVAVRERVGVGAAGEPDEPVAWPPPRAQAPPRALPRKGPVLGKGRPSSLGWPAVALLLAMALGGVMLAQRRMINAGSEPVATTVEVAPLADDSADVPAGPRATDPAKAKKSDSSATRSGAAPSERSKRAAKKPTVTAATRPERSERVERTRRAVPDGPPAGVRYTVIVGSYLKADMAWAEREHLSRLTSYPVWVSRRSIEGVRTYRIILGAFESVDVAETSAQALLQRGVLRDARVVPLPLSP